MQQLTFITAGRFEWREALEPRIEDAGDAIVEPVALATCDLDSVIARGAAPVQGTFAFGHGGVGRVVEVAEGVADFAAGDVVSIRGVLALTFGVCAGGGSLVQHPLMVARNIRYGQHVGELPADLDAGLVAAAIIGALRAMLAEALGRSPSPAEHVVADAARELGAALLHRPDPLRFP